MHYKIYSYTVDPDTGEESIPVIICESESEEWMKTILGLLQNGDPEPNRTYFLDPECVSNMM